MVRVALYARVSKAFDQTAENQLYRLREWAKSSGYEVQGEYVDEISSRKTRPQKELVMKLLREGVVNGVAFVRLDRWGRSSSELAFFFDEAQARKWIVVCFSPTIDLSTPEGRLMASVAAAFAAFERDLIRERTIEGLEARKAWGVKLGRPKGSKDKKKRKEKTPPEKVYGSPYGAKGN